MSAYKRVFVQCNRCGRSERRTESTVKDARAYLRRVGWVSMQIFSMRDWCPHCASACGGLIQKLQQMSVVERKVLTLTKISAMPRSERHWLVRHPEDR